MAIWSWFYQEEHENVVFPDLQPSANSHWIVSTHTFIKKTGLVVRVEGALSDMFLSLSHLMQLMYPMFDSLVHTFAKRRKSRPAFLMEDVKN